MSTKMLFFCCVLGFGRGGSRAVFSKPETLQEICLANRLQKNQTSKERKLFPEDHDFPDRKLKLKMRTKTINRTGTIMILIIKLTDLTCKHINFEASMSLKNKQIQKLPVIKLE